MVWYQAVLTLLGQAPNTVDAAAQNPAAATGMGVAITFAIVLVIAILIIFLAGTIARSLRMPNYGWKIGLILLTIAAAAAIDKLNAPKFGIDLRGGIILVYEVNEEEVDEDFDINALVQALKQRVNPGGVKEVVIQAYGDRQVEFIIPEVGSAEIERIKQSIIKAGHLQFRILAERQLDPSLVAQAEKENELAKLKGRLPPRIVFEAGEPIGEWVQLAKNEDASIPGEPLYKVDVQDPKYVKRTLKQGDAEVLEVLAVDDSFDVEGTHLRTAVEDYDESLAPCIGFTMKGPGAALFGGLTSSNLQRRLGIVMDKELISAPTIQSAITDRGRITGRFTVDEVQLMVGVLKAGRLPAALKPEPIAENDVSSILGADTIRSGTRAIIVSLISVLVFMAIYYRFAGVIACMALAANLALILAIMILIDAAFTLPGLAGLVLTVGMSVDANVLIFERIREELKKGAALRMAIRNGFARATTTIVDANLTTLITAVVLYIIGRDQVRGFAVTLILGILMSMYTAIFCSRVIFDIAERRRWITRLGMTQLFGKTNFDFIGKRKLAAIISVILIVIGVSGAAYRGKKMLDIDFNGGTSVQILFKEPVPIEDVRRKLRENIADYDPSVLEIKLYDRQDTETTTSEEQQKRDISYQIATAITGDFDWNRLESQDARDMGGAELIVKNLQELFQDDGGEVQWTGEGLLQLKVQQPLKIESAKKRINEALSEVNPQITAGSAADVAESTDFQIQVTLSGVGVLQTEMKRIFGDKLALHSIDVGSIEVIQAPVEPQVPAAAGEDVDSSNETSAPIADDAESQPKPPAQNAADDPRQATPRPPQPPTQPDESTIDLPSDTLLAFAGDIGLLAQADTADPSTASDDPQPATTDSDAPDPAPASSEDTQTAAESDTGEPSGVNQVDEQPGEATVSTMLAQTQLTFNHEINRETVEYLIEVSAQRLGVQGIRVEKAQSEDELLWNLTLSADHDTTEALLGELQSTFNERPVWLSSNSFGGKVAGDTRNLAIAALVTSLFFIVGYIWIRFRQVIYGLAAVVALVHDVLITLGALAVSFWLADFLGFLLITDFKINLPIVAAFLTIIGYSLNDTIVVFDRIREVRGKSPNLVDDMINTSINQTLSRTMLTSLTTMLVVSILYFAGGESIHGFAFALIVGVVSGTYSSIFVASPVLLWMGQGDKRAAKVRGSAAAVQSR